MKYFCQNVKTLENGITGALNFDQLKFKKNGPKPKFRYPANRELNFMEK